MIKTSFKEAITSNLDLTIVVPTYNLGHYLPETLKSIQQQTIDFELWLIDDASTDGTAQTVADFVKGIPNFHATGFNDHRGIAAARNFGIDHATGGTIPCQVDTYKNENTIFLIRPNRGNIPPRFGHFF